MKTRSPIPMFMLLAAMACSVHAGEFISLSGVSAPDSFAPHLSVSDEGAVVMNWLEPSEDGHALRFTVLLDGQWGSPRTVASGGNWFVNWADFPSVVPIEGPFWAAHWLVSQPDGGYAYDVFAAVSSDAGQNWSEPFLVHDDQTATEHGFVSLYPHQGGAGLIWLDGRHMLAAGHDHGSDGSDGAMTLRSAVISPDAKVHQPSQVDDRVCDCCQTDIAVTEAGPVAVYRNRSEDEIRDIYFSRLVEGQWSTGKPVSDDGWQISGCPVNGPAIASRDGRMAVAWYTGADEKPSVKVAFSSQDGEGFDPSIEMDGANPFGGVDVLLLEDGDAVVSWLGETGDGQAVLRLQRVSPSGNKGVQHQVAVTSAGRMTGFPQMVSVNGQIVLAWTDRMDEKKVVRSAWIALASI